jgi:DNA-binding FadR family transcriptional regulator
MAQHAGTRHDRMADETPSSSASNGRNGRRLYQTAQRAIQEYILEHRLAAGDPLPSEGRLAQELGISRSSIREAVKALESVGVLETRPGVGLFVRRFSFDPIVDNLAYNVRSERDSLMELLYVRKQLEAGAVEDVARRRTADQVRVLRSIVDRMGERAAAGQAFPEEDRFFHRTLYTGLANPLLCRLLDVFWEVYQRLRGERGLARSVDPLRAWEHHQRIVEAIEAGDGAGARAAMRTHFAGLEGRVHQAAWDGGSASAGDRQS